jgi:hypothetical protein
MRIHVAVGTAFLCAASCLAQGNAGAGAREARTLSMHFAGDSAQPVRFAMASPLAFSSAAMQQQEDESKTAHYSLMGGGLGAIAGLLVDTVRNFTAGQPPVCMNNPASAPCTTEQASISPPFGTGILIGAGAGLIVGALVGHQMTQDSRVQLVTTGTRNVALMAHASW